MFQKVSGLEYIRYFSNISLIPNISISIFTNYYFSTNNGVSLNSRNFLIFCNLLHSPNKSTRIDIPHLRHLTGGPPQPATTFTCGCLDEPLCIIWVNYSELLSLSVRLPNITATITNTRAHHYTLRTYMSNAITSCGETSNLLQITCTRHPANNGYCIYCIH
jgi:hypothetical protein